MINKTNYDTIYSRGDFVRTLQVIQEKARKELERIKPLLEIAKDDEATLLFTYNADLNDVVNLRTTEMTSDIENYLKVRLPELYYEYSFHNSREFADQISSLSNEQLDELLKDDKFLNMVVTAPDRHVLSNFLYKMEENEMNLENYSYFTKNDFNSYNIINGLKSLENKTNFDFHYIRNSENSRVEIGDKINYTTLIKSDIVKNNIFTSDFVLNTITDPKDQRDFWFTSGSPVPELSKFVIMKHMLNNDMDITNYINQQISTIDPNLFKNLEGNAMGRNR